MSNTQAEPLTDRQIDDLWVYRDCIEAIQAGDILAQVRCVVRAATQNAMDTAQSQRAEIERMRAAAEAVLSNEEHAVSCGARSYQKASPTWQVYEDLRQALTQPTEKP